MLTSMSNFAGVLGRQGKYEEAELINRQTLARSEKVVWPQTYSEQYSVRLLLRHVCANWFNLPCITIRDCLGAEIYALGGLIPGTEGVST